MFKLIGNCIEYAHLVPQLKTIDEGSILDVLELKLELIEAKYEKLCGEKKKEDECSFDDEVEELENNNPCSREDLEKRGTVILLLDKIKEYKKSADRTECQKIEIMKLIYELI